MADIFDFDRPPPLYAVMGNPVAHSRSPQIHQLFARQLSLTIDYRKIHVEVGGFRQAVSSFQAAGGRGLNVTVPFKVEAWRLCDACSERASIARAANTLWFEDGAVHGDNTDGVGMCTDITVNLKRPIAGSRLLLLGAGGAVRGVLGQLLDQHPRQVVIANRTVDRAVELANHYAGYGNVLGCGFEDLAGRRFDLVVNGTSAGLHGEVPALPAMVFERGSLAYDMLYADRPTGFMTWAMAQGAAEAHDGLGMLVEQAAESFRIWHGVSPDTAPVIQALRGHGG